jgi:uncharacterized protein YkwD
MMGGIRWQSTTQTASLLVVALVLVTGVRSSFAAPGFDPTEATEPAPGGSAAEPSAQAFLASINGLRRQKEQPPLEISPTLSRAAEILLGKALAEAIGGDFDTDAGLTLEDLRGSGYDPQHWAEGLVSSEGEPAEIIALWQQYDSHSFAAFLEPDLRDFGLAAELRARNTVYALVAAVSRDQVYRPVLDRLSDLDAVRQQMLERVNRERAQAGLRPLRLDRQLVSVAQTYAERMMAEGFYGHVSPSGETALDRIEFAGYRPERSGENLASGPESVELVMDLWMASPGHRQNILDDRFRDLGIGLSAAISTGELRILWVQCFGSRRP